MIGLPMKLLVFSAISLTLSTLATGSEKVASTWEEAGEADGFLDTIGAIFSLVGALFTAIFEAVIFNVPGAPWWIQFPFALINGPAFVWFIIQAIEAATTAIEKIIPG